MEKLRAVNIRTSISFPDDPVSTRPLNLAGYCGNFITLFDLHTSRAKSIHGMLAERGVIEMTTDVSVALSHNVVNMLSRHQSRTDSELPN